MHENIMKSTPVPRSLYGILNTIVKNSYRLWLSNDVESFLQSYIHPRIDIGEV